MVMVSGKILQDISFQSEGADCVALVAGDTVKKLSSKEFLARANKTGNSPDSNLPSPVIPSGYDRVAQYQMRKFVLKREHLAMCSSVMSLMANRQLDALRKISISLEQVLESDLVAPVTTVLECTRRAIGTAALLVASSSFMKKGLCRDTGVVIVSRGFASGPLYPPNQQRDISEIAYSCEEAASLAHEEAQSSVRDIDFFGLFSHLLNKSY
jgi:hypothetical protein